MDGIADMGGSPGWGRVPAPAAGEPPFPEVWQGRAFALTLLTMGRISGRNLDAFRHALERLDPDDYLADGYYGRWIRAAELMLVESAILAPGAVDARARANGGADVPQPPVPEPARPDYAATGPGSLRMVEAPPRFAVGERVRARAAAVDGHTRLPRYVRGHAGVVAIVQPAALLPDTHAHFAGEHPQHVYAVAFTSSELWGAGAEPFTLTVDLFESYLEPAGGSADRQRGPSPASPAPERSA